jgi:hypothetical protein
MEVGQGPNAGCSAKGIKKEHSLDGNATHDPSTEEHEPGNMSQSGS